SRRPHRRTDAAAPPWLCPSGRSAVSTSSRRHVSGLLLVEPQADQRGGHHAQSLPLLAAAAARAGHPAVLVAPRGIDPELRAALAPHGTVLVSRPHRRWGLGAAM